jgi:hypothetical protein
MLYLGEQEEIALIGFAVVATITAYLCFRIRKGDMPATCDLCGENGTLKAEYGAGFSNARLILNCPHCGRVINKASRGTDPQQEK